MKKIICVIMAVTIMCGLCSCSKRNIGQEGLSKNVKKISDDVNVETVNTTSTEADSVEGFADFMLELFKNNIEDGENCMISPLSVITAMAMTTNGAKGNTLSQMLSVLSGGKIDNLDTFNNELAYYTSNLTSGKKDVISIANSLWIKDNEDMIIPKEEFLTANGMYYNAEIYKAPFDNTTISDINFWVSDKTKDRIKEIITELSDETVMCLINAISFDGEWVTPFEYSDVGDGVFTKADNTEQNVKMMHSSEHYYIKDENATGFIKSYKDGFDFVAILPNEGVSVEEYIAGIDGKDFVEMIKNPVTDRPVRISLPKFSHEYSVTMNEILMNMGISDAFSADKADFSGMYSYLGYESLYIGEVIHKTFIEVDELGTKAAAATEVIMECGTSMEKEYYVYLDRPFVYAITDSETGLPVFIGVVNAI